MSDQEAKLSETARLIAAVEDVAEQLYSINSTLERFMELTLTDLGAVGDRERFAVRILPIT